MTQPMTAAMQKVQDHRDMINAGRNKIMADDNSCVVYTYENAKGKPCVIGYKGRAKKPAFCYWYPNEEARDNKVSEWMESQASQKKARKESTERQLEVGDVLRCSWGYEQTNIDYYLVTKLVGKTSVEVAEIGQKPVEAGDMYGQVLPDPENIVGEPFTKRANGKTIKINSFSWAHKKDMIEGPDGLTFAPDQYTRYH